MSTYEVKDKIFIVTGGAAGIGAGVARALLEQGAKHVAVLDLDVTNGKSLEGDLTAKHGPKRVKFYKCDVTTKELEDIYDAVVKEFGHIDAVVNNAGIMNDSPKVFVKQIEVNVTALIRSSMKAYELMRKDRGGKGGAIINIASIAAIFHCDALPIYAATKTAVLQFSNCLGTDLHYQGSGVRVIAICFGCTDTSLLHNTKYGHIDQETDAKNVVEEVKSALPMQTPESAVKGLIEAYKRGASGSTWLVSANLPAKDITANIQKGFEIMGQGITDQ